MKTIRKARKIGRPKLAKLTGLSERQITKIETAEIDKLSHSALGRVAAALHVDAVVLTGDTGLSDGELQPLDKPKCTSGCCG
mgnify:FL=1